MNKLRLGLLGTGIAPRQLYLPGLLKLRSRIALVACANRTRSKAESYARLAGIPKVVDTGEELFRLPEVDAILISLPIDQQPAYVLKALATGKAVLSEKPVAPNQRAGRALLKAAARFDAPWLIGENFAFMPHVHKLKQWLEQERLGRVRLVEAQQMTWMDRKSPYFHTSWRAHPGHVGGFVGDAGVHLANMIRRCFGTPKVVKTLTASFNPELPPLDTAVALLEFDSGAFGTWTSCFTAHHQGPMLRVYGSKGTAELHWNTLMLRNPAGRVSVFKSGVDSFEAQFRHFADVVLKGHPPRVTPQEALEDLALVEAIATRGRIA